MYTMYVCVYTSIYIYIYTHKLIMLNKGTKAYNEGGPKKGAPEQIPTSMMYGRAGAKCVCIYIYIYIYMYVM